MNYFPNMMPNMPPYNPFQANAYQQLEGRVNVPCYKCGKPSNSECGLGWNKGPQIIEGFEGCGRKMCDDCNVCDEMPGGSEENPEGNPFLNGGICQECKEAYETIYWPYL